MGIKISAIDSVGTIYKEWQNSVKRRPLQKGVARYVTIVKNGFSETLGKDANGVISLERKLGNEKILVNRFPDGSTSVTSFYNDIPKRTNGKFVVKAKDGEIMKVGYGIDGYSTPDVHKKVFLANLDRLWDPKYRVNLKEIDEMMDVAEGRKSRFAFNLKKSIKNLFKPVTNFLEAHNESNSALRKWAKNIDKNA